MADQKPNDAKPEQKEAPKLDPQAAFRDVMAQWEKGFNKLANDTMGTEAFAQAMHKFTNVPMGMQNQIGEMIGRYLSALNLPSRAEMVNIAERIKSMEASLARIEARLVSVTNANAAEAIHSPPPTSRPPRTKKPPSAKDSA